MTRRPLAGFTIGVTADRRAEEQIKLLAGRGATCIHGPVIKTHPVAAGDAFREATEELHRNKPQVVVMTTGLGVRSWMEGAESLHLADELSEVLAGAELMARGPKANGALVTAGFEVGWTTPNSRYDDVVELLAERGIEGQRVAVQLDGAGALSLCQRIEELGADVIRVPVYRWSLPEDTGPAERLISAAIDGRIDGVTFTARPAVENFLEIGSLAGVSDELEEALRSRVTVFCVGPVCATGMTDSGFDEPLFPERYRLGAMIHQISNHYSTAGVDTTLGGREIRLQGRVTMIAGDEVSLSDRERAVLEVLLERPGVVYSKDELLRRVWRGTETDRHLVEVTVARLRRRLGTAADGIETVFRRGYRAVA